METTNSSVSSVKELADTIGIPVEKLLDQLRESGIGEKSAEDVISLDEKSNLLSHLRQAHGGEGAVPRRISLKRKVTTELDQPLASRLSVRKSAAMAGGRAAKGGKVKLVVRKKRTYVKRSDLDSSAKEAEVKVVEPGDSKHAGMGVLLNEEIQQAEPQESVSEVGSVEHPAEHVATELGSADAQLPASPSAAEPVKADLPDSRVEVAIPVVEAAVVQKVAPDAVAAAPVQPVQLQQPRKQGKGRSEDRTEKKIPPRRNKVKEAIPAGMPRGKHIFERPVGFQKKEIVVGTNLTVGDLAAKMSIKAGEVIKVLMGLGQMMTINQKLDQDTALLVVEELGHQGVSAEGENPETQLGANAGELSMEARAPVVTVMGHVDHGKTTLLDYVRNSRVAAGEAGGITQHVGAYHVETENGTITFLDTPGHEAFTAMRARGAALTDVIVLVVAADDGVMPQTLEAIQHAKASKVPIIVAINKIDKSSSDPERVKQELVNHGVIPEEWGGENMFVNLSAKTGAGVKDLLDAILLQAEVLELRAISSGPARGTVVESRLDKGRGPVATILIQSGLLKQGDVVLAGREFGRARMLFDEAGIILKTVGPSMPVEVLGLSGIPVVGDPFHVVEDERQARTIAEYRRNKSKDTVVALHHETSDDIFTRLRESRLQELNIILKADVHGSVEALSDALRKLGTNEVAVKIVASGVGGITETDVNLALSTGSLIMGFNVRADATSRRIIREKGINLRYHSIIYEALDEVKRALEGMLAPESRQEIIGLAEVKDVFRSRALGSIAGCLVTEGMVRRNSPIRVLRNNVVIFEGELESLRRHKDDVSEVRGGTECGIGVKGYDDVVVGDQIECFEVIKVERKL